MAKYTKEDVRSKIEWEGFYYWISSGYFRLYKELIPDSIYNKLEKIQNLLNEVGRELREEDLMVK